MLPGITPTALLTPSTRQLTLSPAYSGNSSWDLDVQGPLTITTAYSGTLTLNSSFAMSISLWGPGGSSSGAVGNNSAAPTSTRANAVAGTATTFAGLTAGAGGVSLVAVRDNTGTNTVTAGGAAGVASGGDTNTNGAAGTTGVYGGSISKGTAGSGAAAPSGGAAQTGTTTVVSGQFPGIAGNAPGGGAAGALGVPGVVAASGGGGSGAKVDKAYAVGALSLSQALVVGDSGAAGTMGLAGGDTGAAGAKGAAGKCVIT